MTFLSGVRHELAKTKHCDKPYKSEDEGEKSREKKSPSQKYTYLAIPGFASDKHVFPSISQNCTLSDEYSEVTYISLEINEGLRNGGSCIQA